MQNDLKISGSVMEFQTKRGIIIPTSQDIDQYVNEIIPGTFKESKNTIGTDLKNYLIYKVTDTATDQALNNLTTGSTISGQTGKDGIVYGTASTDLDGALITTKNAGGTGAENYVEFYGYIDGAVTLQDYLYLGFNIVLNGTTSLYELTKLYASYAINQTVDASRRYHFYWKLTIS